MPKHTHYTLTKIQKVKKHNRTPLTVSKRSKHHTLVTPAGQKCVNATKTQAKTCIKTAFKAHCTCFIESILY